MYFCTYGNNLRSDNIIVINQYGDYLIISVVLQDTFIAYMRERPYSGRKVQKHELGEHLNLNENASWLESKSVQLM